MSDRVEGGARAALQGTNTDAIGALYDTHGSLCYRLAYRMIADEQLAASVVQEAFLAVWSGRVGAFDPTRGSVRAWLLHITHDKAVDKLRSEQGHRFRNPAPDLAATVTPNVVGENGAWDDDQREYIVAAFAGLSEERRHLLQLAYFGHYNQDEIAELTSTPVGLVKTLIREALRQLRRSLDAANADRA